MKLVTISPYGTTVNRYKRKTFINIYLFKRSKINTRKGYLICRSSHPRCSVKKGVLKHFAKFTGKHLCQRLFFNKVAGFRPATLLKKSLWHRCFPVNFVKFPRTRFLQNTSRRLLLDLFKLINKDTTAMPLT